MVICLILHIHRVYLTGGFIKPREFIWITGIILALLTVSFGITGYSLAWDQVGYWACKIVTAVPEALDNLSPHIGSTLVLYFRGSQSVTQTTLSRFYSIHTFVLPLVTLILAVIHFSMLRKQGISGPITQIARGFTFISIVCLILEWIELVKQWFNSMGCEPLGLVLVIFSSVSVWESTSLARLWDR